MYTDGALLLSNCGIIIHQQSIKTNSKAGNSIVDVWTQKCPAAKNKERQSNQDKVMALRRYYMAGKSGN